GRRLQRRHAPGRRHPRDHARRPRSGRPRDCVRRRRGSGQRRRDERHGLPPERRVLARARAAAADRVALAVLRAPRGVGPSRRPCARGEPARGARRLGRAARAAARQRCRDARARPAPRAAWRRVRGAAGDRRLPGGAPSPFSPAGDLGAWAVITLGEGNTPLLAAPRLSERLGVELWLKWEGMNPTGSFKDRGMAVAVSRALERGAAGVVCASTGNTAASCSAYAARAGMPAVVITPRGAVARGKLAQARVAGAELREIDGTFEDAHREARRLADEEGFVNVNSINPDRIEGQSSAAREVIEQLGRVPDVLALPFGGGGNTVAYAAGFGEGLPRFVLGEAERRADTFASAIRIVEPVHRLEVDGVLERSGGTVVTLTEKQLEDAWRLVAREEGVFCEPASAAGIAAAAASGAEGAVVCVVTGHGLKDVEAVA